MTKVYELVYNEYGNDCGYYHVAASLDKTKLQAVPNAHERYFNACHRHLNAWWAGEMVDGESGLPHLAHAVCCLMFLMWFDGSEK